MKRFIQRRAELAKIVIDNHFHIHNIPLKLRDNSFVMPTNELSKECLPQPQAEEYVALNDFISIIQVIELAVRGQERLTELVHEAKDKLEIALNLYRKS